MPNDYLYISYAGLKGLYLSLGKLSLFVCFIHLKAGIANAISSFKWRSIAAFMKNRIISNLNIWLTEHLTQTIYSIWVGSFLCENKLKLYIYTTPAAQSYHKYILRSSKYNPLITRVSIISIYGFNFAQRFHPKSSVSRACSIDDMER